MPKNIFAALLWLSIRAYKIFISPVIHLIPGTGCRFYPTCSEYALEAISKHGAFFGLILAVCRLLRCQPFCEGGLDYVPEKFEWRKLFSRNLKPPRNNIDEKRE